MKDFLREAIKGHSRENVAAAAQAVFEKTLVAIIKRYLDKTGLEYVALNGGVVANVKLNQRIAALPQVKQIFVFPGMSDTGNSVGAALLYQKALNGEILEKKRRALPDVYLGAAFTDAEIEAELTARGLRFEKLQEDELIDRSAKTIHAGRIIGWFQGRMEFGPRALGNRSMVARATDADINKWLNARLERTEFMPFAPSVMEEYADEIFEGVEKARHAAEFMTVTFDVKKEWQPRIPAVVHVDSTARPQLVTTRTNPRYHALISAYQQLSGIPVVLNTSFNAHEEPIVCKPADAIQAFQDNRIDCLAIGSFWLEHPPS
jgi:carbamoyltransferase